MIILVYDGLHVMGHSWRQRRQSVLENDTVGNKRRKRFNKKGKSTAQSVPSGKQSQPNKCVPNTDDSTVQSTPPVSFSSTHIVVTKESKGSKFSLTLDIENIKIMVKKFAPMSCLQTVFM